MLLQSVATPVLLQLDVMLILLQQVLELLLLLEDLLVVLDGAHDVVLRTRRPTRSPLRRHVSEALFSLAN